MRALTRAHMRTERAEARMGVGWTGLPFLLMRTSQHLDPFPVPSPQEAGKRHQLQAVVHQLVLLVKHHHTPRPTGEARHTRPNRTESILDSTASRCRGRSRHWCAGALLLTWGFFPVFMHVSRSSRITVFTSKLTKLGSAVSMAPCSRKSMVPGTTMVGPGAGPGPGPGAAGPTPGTSNALPGPVDGTPGAPAPGPSSDGGYAASYRTLNLSNNRCHAHMHTCTQMNTHPSAQQKKQTLHVQARHIPSQSSKPPSRARGHKRCTHRCPTIPAQQCAPDWWVG